MSSTPTRSSNSRSRVRASTRARSSSIRVRAENRGGHSDWVIVELVPPRKLVQRVDSAVLDKPPIETAPRAAPPPDLKSPFSTGSSGAVASTSTSANAVSTSTAIAGANRANSYAPNAPRESTTETAKQEQHRKVEKLQEDARRLKAEAEKSHEQAHKDGAQSAADWIAGAEGNSELAQPADNPANPTPPLEPASTAAAEASEVRPQAQSKVDPSGPVELNPQPLPPKATKVLEKGQPQVVAPTTAQSTTIAKADTALQQSPHAIGTGGHRVSDLAAGEIICRGIDTVAIVRFGTAPDNAEISMMYFSPAKEPARPDGSGLEPGKCGYVDVNWPTSGPG